MSDDNTQAIAEAQQRNSLDENGRFASTVAMMMERNGYSAKVRHGFGNNPQQGFKAKTSYLPNYANIGYNFGVNECKPFDKFPHRRSGRSREVEQSETTAMAERKLQDEVDDWGAGNAAAYGAREACACPPTYLKCDSRETVLSPELFGTNFDAILVDPPWEEYVHRAPSVGDHMEY
ncbi:hypothetical protein SUGI_0648840 [Cryptomeria japonica]|nr:hypothetical protein SUGI_0648840 [Cryptomeria japonica]